MCIPNAYCFKLIAYISTECLGLAWMSGPAHQTFSPAWPVVVSKLLGPAWLGRWAWPGSVSLWSTSNSRPAHIRSLDKLSTFKHLTSSSPLLLSSQNWGAGTLAMVLFTPIWHFINFHVYRVAQVKWGLLTFLMVTFECIVKTGSYSQKYYYKLKG